MPAITLRLPDAGYTAFGLWAGVLVQDLAAYNVPTPPSTEEAWQPWAIRVHALPEMIQVGCPDPRRFSAWKAWAAAFRQVTG